MTRFGVREAGALLTAEGLEPGILLQPFKPQFSGRSGVEVAVSLSGEIALENSADHALGSSLQRVRYSL